MDLLSIDMGPVKGQHLGPLSKYICVPNINIEFSSLSLVHGLVEG